MPVTKEIELKVLIRSKIILNLMSDPILSYKNKRKGLTNQNARENLIILMKLNVN